MRLIKNISNQSILFPQGQPIAFAGDDPSRILPAMLQH
jgi:hypothetical protein